MLDAGDSYDSVFDFSAAEGDRLEFGGFGLTFAQAKALMQDTSFNGLASTTINFASLGFNDQLVVFGVAPAQIVPGMVLDGSGQALV